MKRHILKRATYRIRLNNRPEYETWRGMIERCTNTKNNKYRYYGGSGIKVCDDWLCFDTFLHDMGKRPTGCTIDRIDRHGNYCKTNCRWATKSEQFQNSGNYKPTSIGERFGKLTVISEPVVVKLSKRDLKRYVDVVCDCGVQTHVRVNSLRTGITTSCGCKRKESLIKRNKKTT